MEIKVLGTGCSRCNVLEKTVKQAVSEIGITDQVEKVDDIQKIMEYGVMRTPALIIDGQIVISGQVPNVEEIKQLIIKHQ